MAYSDVIIRQCGPRDADSDNDLRILWRMLKMMKTGFIRYLLAIIFMSAALSVFDMITALLFKNIIFRVENYAQRNMFAGLLKEVLLCAGIGCLMLFIYALSFYVYTMEAKKGGADLQKALYSKCMRLPYSYYEQTGSSEFMSKVINDCERAQGIYGSRFRRTAGKRLSGAGKSKRLPRIAVQCGGGFQYPCVPSIPETGIRGSGHYSGRLPQ